MPDDAKKIDQICDGLNMISEDNSIPRNIRRGAEEVKQILLKPNDPIDLRVASATSILDELANDPNIPLRGGFVAWLGCPDAAACAVKTV